MKITLAYPLTASKLASMVGGRLTVVGDTDPTVTHVCTDSREADENTLFCAIRGERVDGHDFMAKAVSLGCRLFLCERRPHDLACNTIQVKDTVEALSALARAYRAETVKDLSVIAITGSVGKTTTKEMTAAVLSKGKSLFKKDGNFNSTIGLPLSFMEISTETDCAVLEMGMSSRGEISAMTMAVRPNIAVIANIGSSHLEYLGSRENIARAKLEIAEGLPEGGTLLVNGDEPLLSALGQDFEEDLPVIPEGIRTLRVSLAGASDADYIARNITPRDGGMYFDLTTPAGVWEGLYIPAVGEHLVWAGSFAAAVGQLSGLTEGQVREGLATYRPANMRQNIRIVGGVTVIEDCYNAAPESMRASLSVLATVAAQAPNARRIAVLGDMKELGADTKTLHRSVGKAAFERGVDLLVTVGELGAEIARGALEAGMSPDSVCVTGGTDTYAATAAYLRAVLREGDHILFKASRSMALETVANMLFN